MNGELGVNIKENKAESSILVGFSLVKNVIAIFVAQISSRQYTNFS
jgi:hypothetical protein